MKVKDHRFPADKPDFYFRVVVEMIFSLRSFFHVLALIPLLALPDLKAQSNDADMEVVKRWLATNSGVGSLKVDFSQSGSMRSLKVPVLQQGTLWLDYGSNRFRWQTGNPAQTIVVSQGKNILIVRTAMKKYEVRPAGAGGAPGMAALANGFPRNLSEFQRKYKVMEIRQQGKSRRIVSKPQGASARGVNTFTFVVDASSHRLTGIEMHLSDGSRINTSFSRVLPNAAVPASLFTPDLSGYTETKF